MSLHTFPSVVARLSPRKQGEPSENRPGSVGEGDTANQNSNTTFWKVKGHFQHPLSKVEDPEKRLQAEEFCQKKEQEVWGQVSPYKFRESPRYKQNQ